MEIILKELPYIVLYYEKHKELALYQYFRIYVNTYTSIWIPKFNIPLMINMHLRILGQVSLNHTYCFYIVIIDLH